MTAAEYRERAAAYTTIIAAFEQQRDAYQREADQLTADIHELRSYQASIADLASIEEGRRRYEQSRRRVGKTKKGT